MFYKYINKKAICKSSKSLLLVIDRVIFMNVLGSLA